MNAERSPTALPKGSVHYNDTTGMKDMKKRRKGRIRDFERERDGKSLEEYRRERHQHVQSTAVQAAPKKKKVRINKGRIALTVIVLVLIAVVGVSIKNVFDLRAEQQELAATQKALAKEKAALEEELKNVNDLEYIEEQARIQLRLIKPGRDPVYFRRRG